MKRIILIGVAFVLATSVPAHTQDRIQVAATSTLFADLVLQIGRDKVEVVAIASPKYNVHFYAPTPRDVRHVRAADLYVHWGLDIEAWSDPLLEAAGNPRLFRGNDRNVDLSRNIPLMKVPKEEVSRSEGDIHLYGNPHYHMNPENFKIMARMLCDALKMADPQSAKDYDHNLGDFLEKLEGKIAQWKSQCAHCDGQEIIAYHEDLNYFADFLGVKLKHFVEPKPGIPPTPRHLEFLKNYAEDKAIKAITLSTYYPEDKARSLAARIGAKVVTIAQNAGEVPDTRTVFDFFDHNIRQISEALR